MRVHTVSSIPVLTNLNVFHLSVTARQMRENHNQNDRVTFSYKVGPCDALPDLPFVSEVRLGHEGPVQPRAEKVVALGIVTAEIEEFCR